MINLYLILKIPFIFHQFHSIGPPIYRVSFLAMLRFLSKLLKSNYYLYEYLSLLATISIPSPILLFVSIFSNNLEISL